ncbi:Spo0B domain-containing protein [Sporosarcina thermotolerans]|uniref:Spo0B domain-containing protein n=1 Tax=Sporosarcina thermotolerans TaxID=633404 RepID=A0AAW9AEP9_9BACL|nr:Spo0B domain-containing protein [Sporosarcina thermotolerans]MDW0118093.1 Spo0B domain-containing protein [Sporosarcina thermotolerans]WHT47586.1 Spo0B domain-containing protein [Sporosarcina thermotolerans]
MGSEKLTVGKALKFARHDFLNDLQLMLLNLDLGNSSEAKKTLMDTTERMRQLSMLEKLRLPETEVWLTTFEWRHTAFSKVLQSNITAAERSIDDAALTDYLERLIKSVETVVDPWNEYNVHITVNASEMNWSIQLKIDGPLKGVPLIPMAANGIEVTEEIQDEQCMFTISGQ